ncbi:hypothetical protein ACCO45_006735 [Purpureocillium lilacinum]|uniref:Uncharacterized protein n=1 Tax=Purpureocillium lilacinum TaxID=33203 RepID=A0ACC4DR32_PURLI
MAPQPHHHMHRVDGGDGGPTDLKSAYWKAWVTALLTKADANRSVAASKYIPMATTNRQVYDEADGLLDARNPVYKGTEAGYCRSLMTYMPQPPLLECYLGKYRVTQVTQPNTDKAKRLLAEMDEARKKHDDAYDAAWKKYNERKKNGDPTATSTAFLAWCDLNDPGVKALEDDMRTKTAVFHVFTSGDGRFAHSDACYSRLSDAMNYMPNKPGSTMKCHDGQVLDVAYKIHTPAGQPKPPLAAEPADTDSYWRPAYTLDPTYRETMDRWSEAFDTAPDIGVVNLDLQDAMKKSWQDLGHANVSAGFDAQSVGVIRVGVQGMKASQEVTNIRHEFPFPPGHTAPAAQKFVRPVQFLCGSGVSVICVLSGAAKTAFEAAKKRQADAHGAANVRLCCLGIDACAAYDNKDNHETSTYTYDANTGKIVFRPTPTFGNAVLLGIRAVEVEI